MAKSLPSFPPFDLSEDQTSIGQRWNKWVRKFENFLTAMNIADDARKKSMLLHYSGDDVYDVYETLTIAPQQITAAQGANPAVMETEYQAIVRALSAKFSPRKNVDFEIFTFRQEKQRQDETVDSFCTRLYHLATNCEFQNKEKEIKAQIVAGCISSDLRRRVLEEPTLNLEQVLNKARAIEAATDQADKIEGKSNETVNFVKRDTKGKQPKKPQNNSENLKKECSFCGGKFHAYLSECPARFHQCKNCKRLHHFETVCKSKQRTSANGPSKSENSYKTEAAKEQSKQDVRRLTCKTNEDSTDEEVAYQVKLRSSKLDDSSYEVEIDGATTLMMADSCATVTILDEETFKRLGSPKLGKTSIRVFGYGADKPLELLGQKEFVISYGTKFMTENAVIAKGNYGNILRKKTANHLGLIKMANAIKREDKQDPNEIEQLKQKYPNIFEGIGQLRNFKVKLHIDETAKPVANPHRRIPFHLRKAVEQELQLLEDLDIIEKVDGPTPWVSPVVITTKPHDPTKIRICVDMKEANKAIKRERHITPTLDDILTDLNGSTVFSKLDLNHGYHQLKLDRKSRFITTFSTHLGLRRYKRLFFGVNSAAEVFQNAICEALSNLEGVLNVSDDILIHGKSVEEHDKRLEAVFKRLEEIGLTLNENKICLRKSRVRFYGFIFSEKGIEADPQKIQAVVNLDSPKTTEEVRSFLGMANYVNRFIPEYATLTDPLRKLTKKNSEFLWTEQCEEAVKNIKERLVKKPILSYFDPNLSTEIVTDASPCGLGAILTQKKGNEIKVVAFASKALTPTEQRYSHLEKEALAIVWACQKFHLYIFGKPVSILTDHKPLVTIFNNGSTQKNPRLERWATKLSPYDAALDYITGTRNPADYMSRHPENVTNDSRASIMAEHQVNYISLKSVPKAMKLEDIAKATTADEILQQVMKSLQTGVWDKKKIPTYFKVKEQLAINSDHTILLFGNRICIPAKLQSQAVKLAHESHLGMNKMKELLRSKIWFPGMDSKVEEIVKKCHACQVCTKSSIREPVRVTSLPSEPWVNLSIDFYGLPTGEEALVIIDDYSRYPEVIPTKSTKAKTTIDILEALFARHGIPRIIRSDNGPPFSSTEFAQYLNSKGVIHRKVTPVWPAANGEAERFMRTLNKMVQTSTASSVNWKDALPGFLLNYRASPHSTTGVAPAKLLFNRNINTKIPDLVKQPEMEWNKEAKARDESRKKKMEDYANKRFKTQDAKIKIGDKVLLENRKPLKNKMEPVYEQKPLMVIKKKGSMVTAKRTDKTVTRNSSFFRPYISDPIEFEEEEPKVENDQQADLQPENGDNQEQPQVIDPVVQNLIPGNELPDIGHPDIEIPGNEPVIDDNQPDEHQEQQGQPETNQPIDAGQETPRRGERVRHRPERFAPYYTDWKDSD